MKKILAKYSDKQQFWTFKIKENENKTKALWYVLIVVGSVFTVLRPVWRKIGANGLPANLGNHGPFTLGGEIRLLNKEGAGPNEIKYFDQVLKDGGIKFTVPAGTNGFSNKEELFGFLASHEDL